MGVLDGRGTASGGGAVERGELVVSSVLKTT